MIHVKYALAFSRRYVFFTVRSECGDRRPEWGSETRDRPRHAPRWHALPHMCQLHSAYTCICKLYRRSDRRWLRGHTRHATHMLGQYHTMSVVGRLSGPRRARVWPSRCMYAGRSSGSLVWWLDSLPHVLAVAHMCVGAPRARPQEYFTDTVSLSGSSYLEKCAGRSTRLHRPRGSRWCGT